VRAGVQVVGILSRVVTCLRVFLQVYTLSVCCHVFVCISTGVHILEYCHVISLVCVYYHRCTSTRCRSIVTCCHVFACISAGVHVAGELSRVVTCLRVFLQVYTLPENCHVLSRVCVYFSRCTRCRSIVTCCHVFACFFQVYTLPEYCHVLSRVCVDFSRCTRCRSIVTCCHVFACISPGVHVAGVPEEAVRWSAPSGVHVRPLPATVRLHQDIGKYTDAFYRLFTTY